MKGPRILTISLSFWPLGHLFCSFIWPDWRGEEWHTSFSTHTSLAVRANKRDSDGFKYADLVFYWPIWKTMNHLHIGEGWQKASLKRWKLTMARAHVDSSRSRSILCKQGIVHRRWASQAVLTCTNDWIDNTHIEDWTQFFCLCSPNVTLTFQ